MDAQELRNLQEAYMQVVENQQLDEGYKNLPRLKMAKKMAGKVSSAFGGAHRAGREGGSPETTGGQIAVAKGQKKIKQAAKMHDVATKHSAEKSKTKEASNKSPKRSGNTISVLDAAKRFGSSSKKTQRPQKKDTSMDAVKRGLRAGIEDALGEQVDIYDIILSHLLDEGYAETPEAAEAIMVNMSEEWRDSITG